MLTILRFKDYNFGCFRSFLVGNDKIVLTGITTSGTPHLGNLVGAIRPAIESSNKDSTSSFLFLADYHSLIKSQDPALTHNSSFEIAAAWLACGLRPETVTFYRPVSYTHLTLPTTPYV